THPPPTHPLSPYTTLFRSADGQHAQEHDHRPEAEQADLAEGHRPGKQEGDFEVEDDEENGHQIVAHVEFDAGILERVEAAFIGRSEEHTSELQSPCNLVCR